MDARVGPITLTESEIIEISVAAARVFQGKKRANSILFFSLVSVLGISVLLSSSKPVIQNFASIFIGVGCVGLSVWVFQDREVKSIYQTIFRSPLNLLSFEPKVYEFSESMLIIRGESGATMSYPWAAMARVSVWESYLMIYPTDMQWFAIPLNHVEPELLEFLLSRKTRSSLLI